MINGVQHKVFARRFPDFVTQKRCILYLGDKQYFVFFLTSSGKRAGAVEGKGEKG